MFPKRLLLSLFKPDRSTSSTDYYTTHRRVVVAHIRHIQTFPMFRLYFSRDSESAGDQLPRLNAAGNVLNKYMNGGAYGDHLDARANRWHI